MIRVVCDGCLALLEPTAGVSVGDLDPVVYCADCAARWAEVAASLDALRLTVVETFTMGRAATLRQARTTLQKLPDDAEGPA